MTDKLTHFNAAGEAHMVDVSEKDMTKRQAIAGGTIFMLSDTLQLIQQGSHKKGDVLGIARVAGIMAAKKTSDLVPLCHPLALTHIEIELRCDKSLPGVYCQVTVECRGNTGVEMEALTAVQITLLTIYDMCKAVDRGMHMENIGLLKKSGGKSGDWSKRD